MSWLVYQNIIEGVLTDNNYREIPENKSIEVSAMSHNHASYRLQAIGTSQIIEYTGNGIRYNHKVLLEIKFKNMNSTERHTNYQSLLNLFQLIAVLDDYKGTIAEPVFEIIDEKHNKGSFIFLFGEENQCP